MHPHHARALKIARLDFRHAKTFVTQSERYLRSCREYYQQNPNGYGFARVKSAVVRLSLAVEALEDALSVVVTVERLLEKA